MRTRLALAVVLPLVAFAFSLRSEAVAVATTQGNRIVVALRSDESSSDQRATASLLDAMIADGRLRLIDRRPDTLIADRIHERYQQTFNGLTIIGADVALQRRNGQLISAFGIVFDGLSIETRPELSVADVRGKLTANGMTVLSASAPLAILPAMDGSVSLVYAMRTDDGFLAYVAADDARVALKINESQTQHAVGQATGTLGDTKKISTTNQGGTFVSQDGLRPPALETFDMQANSDRVIAIARGQTSPNSNDLARSANNVWNDGAVVDAHVHAGWVYDYYFRRFQRRGLDNNDIRIQSFVHPVRAADINSAPSSLIGLFYLNAFYNSACRCMVYGDGAPPGAVLGFPSGIRNFAAALDVVGHELTHAVTDASSRLAYLNESGALNEAFSDIMGTSIEFFYQQPGAGSLRADYTMGEDLAPVGTGLMRSMVTPLDFGQPDHFSQRSYIGALSGDFDSGGVHTNSGIASNAFYLAIEGGTHRTSRRTVTGVGAANREQIEKIFYRAFTSMLSSNATFYLARLATIQSARDLYGAGTPAERAITDAWDAVGVTSPAAALTTTFSPRSVPANNTACAAGEPRPSFTFRVAVSEFQRVGFSVAGFNVYSYDSQGRRISLERFSPATFRSWFADCQAANTRIGPGATACATLCGDLGGRTSGFALFEFLGSDDNGNPGVFNSDFISFGLPARNDVEEGTTAPTFQKAVRQ